MIIVRFCSSGIKRCFISNLPQKTKEVILLNFVVSPSVKESPPRWCCNEGILRQGGLFYPKASHQNKMEHDRIMFVVTSSESQIDG